MKPKTKGKKNTPMNSELSNAFTKLIDPNTSLDKRTHTLHQAVISNPEKPHPILAIVLDPARRNGPDASPMAQEAKAKLSQLDEMMEALSKGPLTPAVFSRRIDQYHIYVKFVDGRELAV